MGTSFSTTFKGAIKRSKLEENKSCSPDKVWGFGRSQIKNGTAHLVDITVVGVKFDLDGSVKLKDLTVIN